MANKEIPDLAAAAPLDGTETVHVVQDGNSRKTTPEQLYRWAAPAGHRFGLTIANNVTHATNDIDMTEGTAASDDTNPFLIALPSALTKRLDAAWAVGTNQGGLDTGSIANTTYHVWLIHRSDTGVTDVLFSASATSPTMPANYDRKAYIAPFVRASGAIVGFIQTGNYFTIRAPISSANVALSTTSTLVTLPSVPAGVSVLVDFDANLLASSVNRAYLSSPLSDDVAVSSPGRTSIILSVASVYNSGTLCLVTDTSGRIRAVADNAIPNSYYCAKGYRVLR